jgi:hypothetical protein
LKKRISKYILKVKKVIILDITLYHGSGVIVETPEIRIGKYYKDFGHGFYCTKSLLQAERWAARHNNPEKGETPTVNIYSYTPSETLKYLTFETMTEEWLDFIVACRRGKSHNYDIVEGPMADDEIWDYVEDFQSGRITREAFWALAKFRYPTHQITFLSDAALQGLTFQEAKTVW